MKKLVHLNDPDTHTLGALLANEKDKEFLGKMIEPIVAQRIARCEIDPLSHENYTELRERRRELKES